MVLVCFFGWDFFFYKKWDSAFLEKFQLAGENGKPKHLDSEKFSDFSQKTDM